MNRKTPEDKPSRLSENLRRFILEKIDSVEQLDVLRLLSSRPAKTWTPEEVSRELRSTPASIAKRLADLCMRELLSLEVQPTFGYRFAPLSEVDLRAIQELNDCYAQFRSRITSLIYSQPSPNLTVFADAFRFREKDHDR